MMMNLQTLVLSLVMQIVSILRRVICPFFFDWNCQDHFLILLPLTSLESLGGGGV